MSKLIIGLLLVSGCGVSIYADTATSTPSPEPATVRTVKYHAQDVIPIHARVNFTSLIVLPVDEEVLEAATGDKDFWIVDVVHNFVFVHPAKEGIRSNINLITNKGNVYSFTVEDVSSTSTPTDLKVIIQPADTSTFVATAGPAQFVPADQVRAANDAVNAVKQQAVAVIDAYKAGYPSKLAVDYEYKRDKKPFYIDSIYHDDKFTYIKVSRKNQEKFAIYEIRDGKPDLITYDLKDGVYTIEHIVNKGYVRVGKTQLNFELK
jgi:type IV secretory pathway VirB9-like protein